MTEIERVKAVAALWYGIGVGRGILVSSLYEDPSEHVTEIAREAREEFARMWEAWSNEEPAP